MGRSSFVFWLGSIANFVCSLFPQPIPWGFPRAASSPSSSQSICMRNASSTMMYDIISFENHRLTCFAWMDLHHVMYCNFTREKIDWHMLCQEWRQISLNLLLVNCHERHGWNFSTMNFAPNRYEVSFKMAKPTRNRKIRTLSESLARAFWPSKM